MKAKTRPWLPLALTLSFLAACGAAIWLPASPTGPSSFSPAPQGSKALYLLLQRLDYRPRRFEQTYAHLPPWGTLLVYEPTVRPSEAETRSLSHWLEDGHTAWVVSDNPALTKAFLGMALVGPYSDSGFARPVRPDPLLAGVRKVYPGGKWRLVLAPGSAGEVADSKGWILTCTPYGRGHLVVATGASLLANAGLAKGDNLRLALNILQGGPILFDEYHHGYTVPAMAGGRRPLTTTDILAPAVLLLLAGLTAVLAFARLGPPVPLPEKAPPWAGEYALAMAGLFRRSGFGSYILTEFYRQTVEKRGRNPALEEKIKSILTKRPELTETELLALAREAVEGEEPS